MTKAPALRSVLFMALLGLISCQLSGPAFCQTTYSPSCVFSTVTHVSYVAGGKAPRIFNPQGVVADAAGNIYFSDSHHQVIYRMSSSGTVNILAGQPDCPGSADGKGNQARFRYPHGLAADAVGNIYVADSGNNTIRKITPVGMVTTLAGCARITGSSDGKGSVAQFKHPTGVAADSAGDIYVADMFNHTIRKITAAGQVTTLAGFPGMDGSTDGRGKSARFNFPSGIAVDHSGDIFITDMFNNAIRKATPDGTVTTLAGRASYVAGHADGTGAQAQFSHPRALAVDGEENVYVADTDNNAIRLITTTGKVTTLAGEIRHCGDTDGCGAVARFWHPVAIALDRTGNLYVADLDNAAIRKGVFVPIANPGLSCIQHNTPEAGRNE